MKGILFKPDMIKAIVEGRKTQTRRVIKPQPQKLGDLYKDPEMCYRQEGVVLVWQDGFAITKSRYQPNEIIYIKESANIYNDTCEWNIRYLSDEANKLIYPPEEWIAKHYADFLIPYTGRTLPAWAARYFITITDVRAERLQEISRNDAIAEGIIPMGRLMDSETWCASFEDQEPTKHPEAAYGRLWNSINKPPYDWKSNPWVWIYYFERHSL